MTDITCLTGGGVTCFVFLNSFFMQMQPTVAEQVGGEGTAAPGPQFSPAQ